MRAPTRLMRTTLPARGRRSLLGKICSLTIEHKLSKDNKTYAKIANASKIVRGTATPKFRLPHFTWDIDDGSALVPPSWMPFVMGQKLEDYVQASYEWRARNEGTNGHTNRPPNGGGATGARPQFDQPDEENPIC